MTFQQFLNILNKRKFSMVIIFILTVTATVGVMKVLPKSYLAEASVVLNLRNLDLVNDGGSARIPTNTHASLIRSRRVGVKVVEALGLSSQQKYITAFLRANKTGNLDINNFIAEMLSERLSVITRKRLDVIKITFEDTSPSFAKNVTNAYVDAYIETIIEMNNELPKRSAFWFSKEVETYKENYQSVKSELETFKKANNISDINEFEYEKEYLAQLNSQFFNTNKELSELSITLKSIDKNLSNFTDVVEDPVINEVKLSLMAAQSDFYKNAAVYDKNHPKYRSSSRQVVSLKSFLNKEIKAAYERLERQKKSLNLRLVTIEESINLQKEKIRALSQKFSELKVLIDKVNEANSIYLEAKKRLDNLNLQAKGSATESEVSILARAVEPVDSFKPKTVLIIGFGIVMGMVLAISYAMLRELIRRRIRIEDDITVSVGLPLLGHLKDGAK